MKDQSISIDQMIEQASQLQIDESKFVYVPETSQLVVIVKETTSKVRHLKSKEQVGTSVRYFEEYNAIGFTLAIDVDKPEENIVASTLVDEKMHECLKEVVLPGGSLQIIVVGEDLETISSRHYFTSALSKDALQRELRKI